MSTRRLRTKDDAVYFGTFTCYRWLPLIQPDRSRGYAIRGLPKSWITTSNAAADM